MTFGKIGARKMMYEWKNPYVTDGLVAMWDGEWNAGGGVHDENATIWKDLTGNNRNLVLYGDSPNWGEKSCNIRERANIFYQQDGSWFRDFWKAQNGVMVELVVSQSYAGGNVFCCGGQSDTWQAWSIIRSGINASRCYARWRNIAPGAIGDWKYLSDDRWIIRGWANQSAFEVWNGQSSADGEFSYQDYAQSPITLSVSGHNISGGTVYACNFHSIRVYDHKISTAEIAANYAIDKERFNLP